jgi:hypothetical protein
MSCDPSNWGEVVVIRNPLNYTACRAVEALVKFIGNRMVGFQRDHKIIFYLLFYHDDDFSKTRHASQRVVCVTFGSAPTSGAAPRTEFFNFHEEAVVEL